jgi:ParB family chromosome partitioning protein
MQLVYLAPQQVELDPAGIREDAGDIDSLAETIRQQGLLQPLGVRALNGDRYQVVYGGRRLRAVQQLGLDQVPCVVVDVPNDDDLLVQQVIENVQRQDLNDIEKARAFARLREQFTEDGEQNGTKPNEGDLDEEVGATVGLAARTIRRYLGLLDLPPEVQHLIKNGELSVTQAQHLRRINNTRTQIELAQMVAEEGLSAGEVSNLANYFAANPNLSVDTAMQALANNMHLRTESSEVSSLAPNSQPLVPAPQGADGDDNFWADEDEAQGEDDNPFGALAVDDDNASKNKARVFRIHSLDQMVDEADRLSRAYHEGDLNKWVERDDNASFKLRLLLKQLRTLTQALEVLVGDEDD